MENTILNIENNIREAYSNIWQPTPLIRWKKINENEKKLQQLWRSYYGKQEWRDVPEED